MSASICLIALLSVIFMKNICSNINDCRTNSLL